VLFGIDAARVDVVVHPESIVHSLVEYVDGSVLAQLSRPDMRLPIAYCLGLPERLPLHWGDLDFTSSMALTFEPPDLEAFPALSLAYEAARLAGAAPAWLSAANEVAVEAFLADAISWRDIVALVASTMDHYVADPMTSLASLYENDAAARRWARASLQN
jgi:1-deoxy-D-xylulose-5-phosphate reductoisomerase